MRKTVHQDALADVERRFHRWTRDPVWLDGVRLHRECKTECEDNRDGGLEPAVVPEPLEHVEHGKIFARACSSPAGTSRERPKRCAAVPSRVANATSGSTSADPVTAVATSAIAVLATTHA
jgi:hypothetical protein